MGSKHWGGGVGAALGSFLLPGIGTAVGFYLGRESGTGRQIGEQIDEAIPRLPEMPKIPEPPAPPAAMTPAESEGVRSGAASRIKRRRTIGQIYLTKGQPRQTASSALGGEAPTLG